MNRFHSILFMVIFAFACSVLAAGNNSFAVAILREGTYDVATVDGDSLLYTNFQPIQSRLR